MLGALNILTSMMEGAQNEANKGKALEGYGELRGMEGWLEQYGHDLDKSQGIESDRQFKKYDDLESGVNKKMDERLTRNMDRIKDMGKQEEKDINQRYDNMQSDVGQNLVRQGLSGTGVAAALGSGVTRERTDAQGRLKERVSQRLTDVDSTLSGQAAEMQASLGTGNIKFKQDVTQQGYMDMERRQLNALDFKKGNIQDMAGIHIGAPTFSSALNQGMSETYRTYQSTKAAGAGNKKPGIGGGVDLGIVKANYG